MFPKSELLSRVGSFLPKIEAANRALSSNNNQDKEALRVDLQLEADDGDDGSSSSDNSDSESSADSSARGNDAVVEEDFLVRERPQKLSSATSSKAQKPRPQIKEENATIELRIALGKFDNNKDPLVHLLAGDNDGDAHEEEESQSNQVEEMAASDSEQQQQKPTPKLLQIVGKRKGDRDQLHSPSKKRPLIAELP